jgi:hypothetical protein
MKARPKSFTMLQILDWKFLITLKPQQKWDVVSSSDGMTIVERDNVTIKIPQEEFEKWFKVVE